MTDLGLSDNDFKATIRNSASKHTNTVEMSEK
jgi:hypothetical protein